MKKNIDEEWIQVQQRFQEQFGEDLDLQGILFLIGVQELGQGKRDFTKNQKMDLMHIAICRLLSIYGFYELQGLDEEGWPHWKATDKLPQLKPMEQERLMKMAVIEYAKEEGIV